MNRDPKHFSDYDKFRPERFLDNDGKLTDSVPDTHDLGHYSFGSGRRYLCMLPSVATYLNVT